jgi:hypothetical protein
MPMLALVSSMPMPSYAKKLTTKLYQWRKPPPVQNVVKSGLHFNILSAVEVNQVISAIARKTRSAGPAMVKRVL